MLCIVVKAMQMQLFSCVQCEEEAARRDASQSIVQREKCNPLRRRLPVSAIHAEPLSLPLPRINSTWRTQRDHPLPLIHLIER